MTSPASLLAHRLACHAEAVCRHYLPHGRREGRYWRVGDVFDTPGQSLYVRLNGPEQGPQAAGKWMDAATGEHGDLLDLLRLACRLTRLRDVLAEARAFLREAPPLRVEPPGRAHSAYDGTRAARRLYALGTPIAGTLAEHYLRQRGIAPSADAPVRFHPRCMLRTGDDHPPEGRPALLARIDDTTGALVGVQRTWLSDAAGKADIPAPRRILGHVRRHAVRIGRAAHALAVGEGLETMLALRTLLPRLPVAATLSAGNLAVFAVPPGVTRLYVAADTDAVGLAAAHRLIGGLAPEVRGILLLPQRKDWNEDLMQLGLEEARRYAASLLDDSDRKGVAGQ